MNTRRIARLPAYLTARAVDAGWLRGHTRFCRFVVLGWYRTGSNLLLSLLNSDPHVVAYSELFSPHGLFWGNHTYAPRDPRGALERDRTLDASTFLARAAFRPHPHRVRAVGFKLFYPQLVVHPVPGLAESLTTMPDLRVIHLRRRNLLRVLVSNRIAGRTGQMAATTAAEAAEALRHAGSLHLTPDACERYFTRVEARSAACEALFDPGAVLRLTYEDLVAQRSDEMARVRSFLGQPPATATTRLVKQATRPLAELVENLDELRRHFHGTRWESFFEA